MPNILNRNCQKTRKSAEKIVQRKIFLSADRLQQLEKIQCDNVASGAAKPGSATLLGLNVDDAILLKVLPEVTDSVHLARLDSTSFKEVAKLIGPKAEFKAQGVLLEISDAELSEVNKSVMAMCLLNSLPVIMFTRLPEVVPQARAYTGNTWPVYNRQESVLEFIKDELPVLRLLQQTIAEDVKSKLQAYKKVNKVKHCLKRGSVALIPFGVHAVNLLGIIRLVKRCMVDTGMQGDTATAKQGAKVGAVTMGKVAIIDEIGDVYQYAIFSLFLAEFATAASLDAAVASIDVLDAALLGSISLVTGVISTIGAYLTRPTLVDTIGDFLANLQLIYLVNPTMRRKSEVVEETDGEVSASASSQSSQSAARQLA